MTTQHTRRIHEHLIRKGPATAKQIAEALGMADPSGMTQIYQRLRRLEDQKLVDTFKQKSGRQMTTWFRSIKQPMDSITTTFEHTIPRCVSRIDEFWEWGDLANYVKPEKCLGYCGDCMEWYKEKMMKQGRCENVNISFTREKGYLEVLLP